LVSYVEENKKLKTRLQNQENEYSADLKDYQLVKEKCAKFELKV